jgi:DNA-binding transcriptional MerR regulator
MESSRAARSARQEALPGLGDERPGYRGPAVCKLLGISYRQLDYWTTTGLVRASVRDAGGSGSQRLYGFEDIVQLKLIKRLLDAGVGLKKIRAAIDVVRDHGMSLGDVTLVSDGTRVYALDDQRHLIDLLQGGQGVFAIAVQPVVAETEAQVVALPSERALDTAPDAAPDVAEASQG